MKLKNKKTGEIIETDFELSVSIPDDEKLYGNDTYTQIKGYSSIKELSEEWEDYEGPKVGYIIDPMEEDYVSADDSGYEESDVERAKELGIWLETKEEAKKTVEKLKAWKRLKDKGFRLKRWGWEFIYNDNISGELIIKAHIDDATDSDGKYTKDLDLLFSQEDD